MIVLFDLDFLLGHGEPDLTVRLIQEMVSNTRAKILLTSCYPFRGNEEYENYSCWKIEPLKEYHLFNILEKKLSKASLDENVLNFAVIN